MTKPFYAMAERMTNKCRHFTSIMEKTCAVGVCYQDVKDPRARPMKLPCFRDDGCSERCSQVSYLTLDEALEQEKQATATIERYFTNLAKNICPFCSKPIESKKQIGRCVYALPCYHRLYQGTVPKDERTSEDQRQIDEASLWEELESEEA